MIEFKARLLIDSQDPELAYSMLRAALQQSKMQIRINDSWLVNNEPLPANSAQQIALAWQRNKSGDHSHVVFDTNDPAVMCELNQIDMFVVEGHVGLISITEEEDCGN